MTPFSRTALRCMGGSFSRQQPVSSGSILQLSSLRMNKVSPVSSQRFSTLSKLAENAQHSAIRRSAVGFKSRPDVADIYPLKLSIGDLDAPTSFKEGVAALATLNTIPYSPSDGLPEAKSAFLKLLNTLGLSIDHIDAQQQVVLTSGGTGAIELALLSTIDRDSSHTVGVLTPSYTNTISVSRDRLGFQVKALPLEFDAEQVGFSFPSIRQVEWFVRENSIRTLVVETYSNPTGAIVDQAYLKALVAVMKDVDGWLVTDEAYANMALTSSPSNVTGVEILRDDPSAPIISVMSTSKWGKMCGGRCGALIASPEVARSAGKIASPTLGPNVFVQHALINQAADPANLSAFKRRVDAQLEEYTKMASQFNLTLPGLTQDIKSSQPEGAIYIVCHIENPMFDSTEFANYCAKQGKVSLASVGYDKPLESPPFGTVLVAPMSEFYLNGSDGDSDALKSPGDKQFRLSLIPGTDMALAAKLLHRLYLDFLSARSDLA